MEQKEEQRGISPYQSPMYNYPGILMLTNPENDLYKMELTFRNMIKDDNGNARPVGDPLMNDKGIRSVVGQVQSLANQISVMSNFSKNMVPVLMLNFGDTLIKDLMMSRVDYNIKNSVDRSIILNIANNYAYSTMLRGLEEGEKRFLGKAQQEIRNIVEQQKQRGAISNLLGWGSNK